MLTLTENASTIVKDITAQQGAPETAGLRITAGDPATAGLLDPEERGEGGTRRHRAHRPSLHGHHS